MYNKLQKFINKVYPKKFHKYWKIIKSKKSKNIDSELIFLTDNFINSKSYKYVSNFWHILNIANYNYLQEYGLRKYGSTVALNYFTFTDFNEEHVDKVLKKIKHKKISITSELFKKQNNFSFKESLNYNLICSIIYYYLKNSSSFNNIKKLKDKNYLGYDDPFIKIDNYFVTIDKLSSLVDFDKINRSFNIKNNQFLLEIGAGSGRLSEAFLSIKNNNNNYIICDIPPALYISYKRLKNAFPKKKISILVESEDPKILLNQLKKNDISFIFPHQISLLSKNIIDLTIAIDCLHEMDKKTLKFYFNNINHFSKNFYCSIWDKTKNNYSKTLFKKTERLHFDKGDYNFPKNWKNHFRENLVFPSNHLSLGFKIKD